LNCGTRVNSSGDNHGIYCYALSIAGTARVTAKGGNSTTGTGCHAGCGVVVTSGVIHNVSTVAGALTATAGAGNVLALGYGAGIGTLYYDLHLTGPGETKATGDYALGSAFNVFINNGKVTAEGKSTGYALYAAAIDITAYPALTPRGGVVTIAGGNVTAKNTATTGHEHYATLNHTGGTYNGATIGGGSGNGNGNNPGTGDGGSGGGGGGGAPTPLALAAMVALVAARTLRKK
jgi:hypothetical protein